LIRLGRRKSKDKKVCFQELKKENKAGLERGDLIELLHRKK
jgi:hypothetical protein